MSILVTDHGFAPDDVLVEFSPFSELSPSVAALDLASDTDPATLQGRLDRVALIRVDFPSFADGRGFTIARLLRLMGYDRRLRARGHVIADQYAMARRAGFDEVEITPEMALRQPQEQWVYRANWQAHDYQARLRG